MPDKRVELGRLGDYLGPRELSGIADALRKAGDLDLDLDVGDHRGVPPAWRRNQFMEEREKDAAGAEEPAGSSGDFRKDFHDAMTLCLVPGKTLLVAVATDSRDEGHNKILTFPCGDCQPFGGYAYDPGKDVLLLKCVEAATVGTVPLMLELSCEAVGPWRVQVPLPPAFAEAALTPQNRRRLKLFRDKYMDGRYRVAVVQLRHAN